MMMKMIDKYGAYLPLWKINKNILLEMRAK
jgi:hypothetical protein